MLCTSVQRDLRLKNVSSLACFDAWSADGYLRTFFFFARFAGPSLRARPPRDFRGRGEPVERVVLDASPRAVCTAAR